MLEPQVVTSQKKTGLVSLPESFFTDVLPKIQDLNELKVVLCAFYLILRKQESNTEPPKCSITYQKLATECLRLLAGLNEEAVHQALNSAVEHGALSFSKLNVNGVLEDGYSLPVRISQFPRVNIFALYEQNIGIITPIIAEELKEAEGLYPPEWIEEAFKEAVRLNKRSWKYIARILERWTSEGKDSGEYKRDTKKDSPDKYIKGKYGHLVKR